MSIAVLGEFTRLSAAALRGAGARAEDWSREAGLAEFFMVLAGSIGLRYCAP
jgi:hypothetical protein